VVVVNAMLGNAAIAALLALIALAIGRTFRSPTIRHAAWLIVLFKLITPPLFLVPLAVLPESWGVLSSESPSGRVFGLIATANAAEAPAAKSDTGPQSRGGTYWAARIADYAIAFWLIGAVVWFVWQGRRIVRFRYRVACAEVAPVEVAAAANRIATALGIAHPPDVKIATGIGSPMLWGRGRSAVVLFPRELLPRLSPEALDTLLAHELAHFLRRDHWVRILEYVVTGIYWWHPAVWLSRRGIEAAEEECCDAWVVCGLAASARRYAEALLETVNFEAELRRPRLPPGACAANHSARLLHTRLVRIIDARPPLRFRYAFVFWVFLAIALATQPVLKAVTREVNVVQEPLASATKAPRPRPSSSPSRPPIKNKEPRSWATATAPGGMLTVLAREREFLLRQPDGTTRTLGPGRPIGMSFAPTVQRLATVGPGSHVRTWDYSGNLLAQTNARATVRAIAYVPDGSRLLILDASGCVSALDSQTLAPLVSWTVEGPANSISCDPEGRIIAVSFGSWLAETGWVELWSIPERRKLAGFPSSAPVGASRISPDGRTLIIGGWNGQIAWRTITGGELIAERQLSKDLVANAAFCPDAGTLPLEPPPEPSPLFLPELTQRAGP